MTLTCRLTEGVPAARLSWLRGITQPEIQPGGRFLIAQEGNVSRLTIQNCSQGTDGGCYVCKAQNPVGLREMFVCLTVKREWGCMGLRWEAGTQIPAAVGEPPGLCLPLGACWLSILSQQVGCRAGLLRARVKRPNSPHLGVNGTQRGTAASLVLPCVFWG